jgi:hypothetical protein
MVKSTIRQGLKTPVSQRKSSLEDYSVSGNFSSLVHFNGLELKLWGFEPLAVVAAISCVTRILALS